MAISEEMDTSEDNSPKRKKQENNEDSADIKSPKRRRDADQKILDQFWVICDPNQTKRNKSLKIIIEILIKQNSINNTNDLMYCLDRVIRGMASARQFARHGFCVLLTQILSIFKSEVSLDLVFNLSEKHLGKVEELSNHDSVIGWSLVMASVIKSERLISENDKQIFENCLKVLYTLGINKQYIELVVCQLFTQLLEVIQNKQNSIQKIVFKKLKEDLKEENKIKPFFVFSCLSVLDRFPNCEENNKFKSLLNIDSFQRISIMIRESTAYHPSVHPFIQLIIQNFMSTNRKHFPDFWNQCIDFTLFTPNQIEKGNLGFQLIKIGLQFVKTPEDISTIFSPSFVRLFIQSLSVKTHSLHSTAQQLCEFFVDFIKTITDSELQLEFVNSFTKQPGSLLFDDISKSKFFSNLLRNLNSDSIKKWTQKLKTIFLTTNKVESNDIFRIRCIQQISNSCKSLTSSEDTDILWENIKFLFFHSFFTADEGSQTDNENLKTPTVPIDEKLRNALKDGFKSSFNHLLHLDSKTSKEKLTQEMQILSSMVHFISELLSNQSIKCLADSNSLEAFHTIVPKVSKLKKKLKTDSSKEIEIKIFISLYSMSAIQLFEEYEEIFTIIPDLNECMKRAINPETEEKDSGPVWSDVLTDLMLSLLTTTSKLTKNVLFSCFKQICSQITNTGIQRLIDAIIPSNDNKLFGGNEDSDEDEEEDEEDDIEEEDEEKGDSGSASESDEENPNTEIDEKFRNDVINALGPAAHNDDDEESVYLSDTEMFQIDETLATVFKTKFSDKKELTEKRNSIYTFRIRCLELIQIFLGHKEISLDQVFVFIDPIVTIAKNLSQNPKQNQLSIKAIQLINQMTKIRDSGHNSLEIIDFKQTLSNLLTVLSKVSYSELQKALIPLISWIISVSKKLFPNNDWYSSDIENALKSFAEKGNCQTPPLFFNRLISVHNEIGFKLFDNMVEYAFNEDIRAFTKSSLVEILLILCKTQASDVNPISEKQLIDIREKCLKTLCNELSLKLLKAQYVSELLRLWSCVDKNIKDRDLDLKFPEEQYEELSSKLKSLSKQKRKKLKAKDVLRKIISNTN